MRRRDLIIAGAATTLLPGCGAEPASEQSQRATKTWTFQFKIRLYLKMRGGEHIAEGVFRSIVQRTSRFSLHAEDIPFTTLGWGEAIPISVGSGNYLFGVLSKIAGIDARHSFRPNVSYLFSDLVPAVERHSNAWLRGEAFDRVSDVQGEIDLDLGHRPELVHAADLNDVESVSFVPLPDQRYAFVQQTAQRSFQSLLGKRATFDRLTIELTDAQVSANLIELLPWVGRLQGAPSMPRSGTHEESVRNMQAARDHILPLSRRLGYDTFVLNGTRGW